MQYFTRNADLYDHATGRSNDLHPPKPKRNMGKGIFKYAGAIYFNSLPNYVKSATSVNRGLSAGTEKLCIFGHLGLVFIWSCFVSCLLLLLYYVICAPVLTEGTVNSVKRILSKYFTLQF